LTSVNDFHNCVIKSLKISEITEDYELWNKRLKELEDKAKKRTEILRQETIKTSSKFV